MSHTPGIIVLPQVTSNTPNNPRERYDAWAEVYDERTASFNWSAPQFLLDAVVRYAPPKGFLRVLDIGVGTGQASVSYLDSGALVTGLDLSAPMLQQAKAKYPQFHALIEHDFNYPLVEAGLKPQSFDVVLSCGAIHFAKDIAQTLSQLRWVLAPGGLLGFTYIPFQERSFSSATKPHSPKFIEAMLRKLGFEILEHHSFVAYYDGGDLSDPVRYQKIIARCTKSAISLPAALQNIDRTACVDRSLLMDVASQPLMCGHQSTEWTEDLLAVRIDNLLLVDVLRKQVARGEVAPKYLPLPKITALVNQANPVCDVLVIMPHPDDESIYAGGTIAGLTQAGHSVRLVVATDGGAGRGGSELKVRRKEELRRAAKILGIESVESLGLVDFGKYRDGARTQPVTAADTLAIWGLDNTLALIVKQIRIARPRILLTLHPEVDPNYSLHGHHLGLGTAVLVAFHLAADPGYVVSDAPELAPWAVSEHHVMIPSHYNVDVMRVEIDTSRKLRAIEAHQSQHYSTQRLITSLKSGASEAIEVCQILQARGRRNFVTALPLNRGIYNIKAQRDWQSSYDSLLSRCYKRHELANLLEQQAEYWGSSQEVFANIQKLRSFKTVAVVTGQQVGILGGAAYTLYKTLGAIQLAQELESQGIPAVPIFWMASYDHDLEEVQRVEVLSKQVDTLNLGLPSAQSPVGSIELGLGIYSLLDEIEASFKNLPYGQEVITALKSAYQADATFAQAFARFLSYLTQHLGLIILDPSTHEFACLARDVIAHELFDGSQAALQETREILASQGVSETIPTNRDVLQMFYTDDNGVRRRLRKVEGGFALQQTNVYLTNEGARNILQNQPERFTPSALMRPLLQDAFLPTIAYVAGPSEQKYFTQLHRVYTWANIPMPQIVARPSFTVVGANAANILSQAGGVVRLINSEKPGYLLGRAGLLSTINLACDELQVLQERCFNLFEQAKANVPVGDAAKIFQEDVEEWLVNTKLLMTSRRLCKVFAHAIEELPMLAKKVHLDLQRSGSAGEPPSTRAISKLAKRLICLERTIVREGRKQNVAGVRAFNSVSPNNALQERHISVAELIAIHGKSLISHLLPISQVDNQSYLVTLIPPTPLNKGG
jgi:bacillithiol biosynthesis cysteine-adding enzyme BshC